MEDWLQDCVQKLNETAYDALNGITQLLSFSTPNTVVIPPVPDYKKIMKKREEAKKKKKLESNSGEVIKNEGNKNGNTKGFETEVDVSKYFASFGLGGIYLSNLNILELVSRNRKKSSVLHFLPDARGVHEYLAKHNEVQIDGILIHPKIGMAVIEIKAVQSSMQKAKNDDIRLPKQIGGKKGAVSQVQRFESFIIGLYRATFGKEIPFPVYKIVCTPKADTGQMTVSERTYLLDQNFFSENGKTFQLFWNGMMTLTTELPNKEFTQFAAVLISLKTAFGLVSTYCSNIISTANNFLNEQKSVLDGVRREKPVEVKQEDKMTYFWLNSEQLTVREYHPGKHFIIGPPGSGKTLLLKARVLKFRDRCVRIYCPNSLTYQYQQFIQANELYDKVEVHSYSVLTEMAKCYTECKREGRNFLESKYGYLFSSDIDIYCDEMNRITFEKDNVQQIFELRPDSGADTFVIGESPDAVTNSIYILSVREYLCNSC